MKEATNGNTSWIICNECIGRGKKTRKVQKKLRIRYQLALEEFKKNKNIVEAPIRPQGHLYNCSNCNGTGLLSSDCFPIADKKSYPHIAIIGGGIGGVALAVACLHRKIPFTLYERDSSFDSRSQGYGLTLQQASRALAELGVLSLEDGVVSTKHIVHTTNGEVIGEWGMRKWVEMNENSVKKRSNIHIARQSLRLALLEQLNKENEIQWNHKFIDYKKSQNSEGVDLSFEVNGKIKYAKADLIVGADGIRSQVRKLLIGEEKNPLSYLGCIVILGICSLKDIQNVDSTLLDSATVFQTVNGNERIYMMPYTDDVIMWQLSFPLSEEKSKELNIKGPEALKKEACARINWHDPIPQILKATEISKISGYPVYDRELLTPELLMGSKEVTLIGDAAHPMSPFKGQGANQALLDALSLARMISIGCKPLSNWRDVGIRKRVLTDFETEMIARSSSKVKGSAIAAKLLHSKVVLNKEDKPRGRY